MSDVTSSPEPCPGCALGRRAFLRESALAAAALAGLGSTAGAQPLRLMEAIVAGREDVAYPIPAADGVSIDKDKEVILVRNGKLVYAFVLACPHENTALKWEESDRQFQCSRHHSKYRPDGTFIEGRATRSMDRLAVRRDGNHIVVNIDKYFESDRDPAGWNAACVAL